MQQFFAQFNRTYDTHHFSMAIEWTSRKVAGLIKFCSSDGDGILVLIISQREIKSNKQLITFKTHKITEILMSNLTAYQIKNTRITCQRCEKWISTEIPIKLPYGHDLRNHYLLSDVVKPNWTPVGSSIFSIHDSVQLRSIHGCYQSDRILIKDYIHINNEDDGEHRANNSSAESAATIM